MTKAYYAVRLVLWFCWELLLSNLTVARTVLRPALEIRPGILAYRTDLRSEMAITWLANLITLTPGTLTVAVSEDRRILYIHTLNVADPHAVTASIRHAFETNLLELER